MLLGSDGQMNEFEGLLRGPRQWKILLVLNSLCRAQEENAS